jgi:hypothetical protein
MRCCSGTVAAWGAGDSEQGGRSADGSLCRYRARQSASSAGAGVVVSAICVLRPERSCVQLSNVWVPAVKGLGVSWVLFHEHLISQPTVYAPAASTASCTVKQSRIHEAAAANKDESAVPTLVPRHARLCSSTILSSGHCISSLSPTRITHPCSCHSLITPAVYCVGSRSTPLSLARHACCEFGHGSVLHALVTCPHAYPAPNSSSRPWEREGAL